MKQEMRNYAIVCAIIVLIFFFLFITTRASAIGEPISPTSPNSVVGSCEGQIEEIRDFIYQSQIHLAYFDIINEAARPTSTEQEIKQKISKVVLWKFNIMREHSFDCQEYLEMIYMMEETIDLYMYVALILGGYDLFNDKELTWLEQMNLFFVNQMISYTENVVDRLLNSFGVEAKKNSEPVPNS